MQLQILRLELKVSFSFKYGDIIDQLSYQNRPNESHAMRNDTLNNLKTLTQVEWFKEGGITATWLNKYSVFFSLIPTRWGLCYNFNMAPSSELLHINNTAPEFHFKADNVRKAMNQGTKAGSNELSVTFPWVALDARRYLYLYFDTQGYREDNPFVDLRGFHLIFHSNFEFPFHDSKNHVRVPFRSYLQIDINPIVREFDDSLMDLAVKK